MGNVDINSFSGSAGGNIEVVMLSDGSLVFHTYNLETSGDTIKKILTEIQKIGLKNIEVITNKGVAKGYVPLDENGKIAIDYLPNDLNYGDSVVNSEINGNIIVNGEEIVVYTHPSGNHITDDEKDVLENIDSHIKTVVSNLMEDYEIVESDLASPYPIYYSSVTTPPTSASIIKTSFTQVNSRRFTVPAGLYCIACEQEFSYIRDTNYFDNTDTFEKIYVGGLYIYTYKNQTLIPMEFTVYF